jgi:hypothetical protein
MDWDFTTIGAVWRKGYVAGGNDPDLWRKDECGAWMDRSQYAEHKSRFGWEIDRIDPSAGDSLDNLRPIQWGNNASKNDGRLECSVTASGTRNVKA